MQGYAPACGTRRSRSRGSSTRRRRTGWPAEAAGLQHAELEEQLDVRGRELMRRLFQGRLDLPAARRSGGDDVAGEDGVVRTRAERGRTRPLVTKFGQVTVSRIAYRSPGRRNVHPLDAALNLPEEKHSHGLRKLAAVEAARGSMEAAGAAITRATGVTIGKRQLEEMARRAAAARGGRFSLRRAIGAAPDDQAAGADLRREGHRDAAGRAAPRDREGRRRGEGKLATRLSPGEKNGRKRMAELACVYDAAPVPRTPEEVISTPAQKRRKKKAQAAKPKGEGKPREPQAAGQVADRLGHR